MQPGKRKHYRLAVESPCIVKVIQEDRGTQASPGFKGMLKDISVAGLLINIEKLKQGDCAIFPEITKPGQTKPKPSTLAIKFTLPHEEKPFVVYFEPRWYDDADLSDPYEYQIGGRIIRIGRRDMDRLQKYLRIYGDSTDTQEFQRLYRSDLMSPEEEVGKTQPSKFYDAVLPMRFRIISTKDGKQSSLCRTTTHQVSLSGVNAEVTTMTVDNIDMVFDETPMDRNKLELEISIPGENSPVIATGEVHWAERFPSKDGYKYFVGIRFLNVSPQDLGLLARFIKGKPVGKNLAKRSR